ncbi:hypothetical protein L798_04251 [Zootermopsis nevadensis]|uniref:Uncharacterized protein n=1 Tax=Zootermopsis nevadensis TaxID=136037 RepID=A0A067QI17_ZOONE|nr:hypothetical protein L798_04251 [Zootermopsis nevadensis]
MEDWGEGERIKHLCSISLVRAGLQQAELQTCWGSPPTAVAGRWFYLEFLQD